MQPHPSSYTQHSTAEFRVAHHLRHDSIPQLLDTCDTRRKATPKLTPNRGRHAGILRDMMPILPFEYFNPRVNCCENTWQCWGAAAPLVRAVKRASQDMGL